MLNRSIQLLSVLIVTGFMLSACGSDEPAAPASSTTAPATSSAPAESAMESDSDPMQGMERAEGVVYQDEIYKNWPYTPTE